MVAVTRQEAATDTTIRTMIRTDIAVVGKVKG